MTEASEGSRYLFPIDVRRLFHVVLIVHPSGHPINLSHSRGVRRRTVHDEVVMLISCWSAGLL